MIMAFEIEDLEVYFHQYCVTCKHEDTDEKDDPCNECLANPSNRNSHKPTMWEAKSNG